jgi:hypothetical protein
MSLSVSIDSENRNRVISPAVLYSGGPVFELQLPKKSHPDWGFLALYLIPSKANARIVLNIEKEHFLPHPFHN